MKTILNYVGQLRIYSLIDLTLLLVAVEATSKEFIGVLFLHIGFLAYLESKHAHNGRASVPKWLWLPIMFTGGLLYQHWHVISFFVCSYLYTKKNEGSWGILSPLFRGMQCFFLLFGICQEQEILLIAFLVVAIRNALGDYRDIEKDKKHSMKTLPMVLGVSRDIPYAHLLGLLGSTYIWWSFANLSVCVLLLVMTVEMATYNLTSR